MSGSYDSLPPYSSVLPGIEIEQDERSENSLFDDMAPVHRVTSDEDLPPYQRDIDPRRVRGSDYDSRPRSIGRFVPLSSMINGRSFEEVQNDQAGFVFPARIPDGDHAQSIYNSYVAQTYPASDAPDYYHYRDRNGNIIRAFPNGFNAGPISEAQNADSRSASEDVQDNAGATMQDDRSGPRTPQWDLVPMTPYLQHGLLSSGGHSTYIPGTGHYVQFAPGGRTVYEPHDDPGSAWRVTPEQDDHFTPGHNSGTATGNLNGNAPLVADITLDDEDSGASSYSANRPRTAPIATMTAPVESIGRDFKSEDADSVNTGRADIAAADAAVPGRSPDSNAYRPTDLRDPFWVIDWIRSQRDWSNDSVGDSDSAYDSGDDTEVEETVDPHAEESSIRASTRGRATAGEVRGRKRKRSTPRPTSAPSTKTRQGISKETPVSARQQTSRNTPESNRPNNISGDSKKSASSTQEKDEDHKDAAARADNMVVGFKPIPRSFEECDEADKMMIRMRDEGQDWQTIKEKYDAMSGATYGHSTLPTRYERLKMNFAIVRDEDASIILTVKREMEKQDAETKWTRIAKSVNQKCRERDQNEVASGTIHAGTAVQPQHPYDPETLQRWYKRLMYEEGFDGTHGLIKVDVDFARSSAEAYDGDGEDEEDGDQVDDDEDAIPNYKLYAYEE
ncbi:hypothetical protein AAFC00_002306 [Neodothiora populina]|uniref:Myb-like domain-containing protein n=1 Tax=Neodothiora populina TaxID=2781224 RepID=A0ABR3PH80_9PEZI